MLIALLTLFAAAALAATYWFFVRPILRRLKVLAEFWASVDAKETSLFEKLRQLFDGLKIKLLARLMWVPTGIVLIYDKVLPYLTGVDLTPVTAMLPDSVAKWGPFAAVVLIPALIDWARTHSSSPPPGA